MIDCNVSFNFSLLGVNEWRGNQFTAIRLCVGKMAVELECWAGPVYKECCEHCLARRVVRGCKDTGAAFTKRLWGVGNISMTSLNSNMQENVVRIVIQGLVCSLLHGGTQLFALQ